MLLLDSQLPKALSCTRAHMPGGLKTTLNQSLQVINHGGKVHCNMRVLGDEDVVLSYGPMRHPASLAGTSRCCKCTRGTVVLVCLLHRCHVASVWGLVPASLRRVVSVR